MVALNRAIAAAYALDKETALAQLLAINGLDNYYIYHTSVGEVYYELGQKEEAKKRYETALALTPSQQEQRLLQSKIHRCTETV